jgi:membrane protein required for colicin V production
MMKAIDFIVLIPLIYGAYDGYKRGFVLTIIGSIALLLGVIGAFKLMQLGIDFLQNYFPHMPKILTFISFISIFLLIVAGVYLLGVAIKKGLDFTIFAGTLDNVAGAVVSVCQWAFITSILIWLTKQAQLIPAEYTKDAPVYQFMLYLAPKTVNWFGFILPFSTGLFKSIKEIF